MDNMISEDISKEGYDDFQKALDLIGKAYSSMEYEYYECSVPASRTDVLRMLRDFLIEHSEKHFYLKNKPPLVGETVRIMIDGNAVKGEWAGKNYILVPKKP